MIRQVNHKLVLPLYLLILSILPLYPIVSPLPAFSTDIDPIETRITEIQQKALAVGDKIAAARSMENSLSGNRFEASIEDLKLRTTLLHETETIYKRQLAALNNQESLKKELAILEEKSKQGKDKIIEQKPPFSLNVYDYYLDQLSNSARQVDVVAQAISVGKKSLSEATEKLAAAGKNLRSLTDSDKKAGTSYEWQRLLADDDRELVQALVDLHQINVTNNGLDYQLAELKQNINQQNIDWLKGNLTFNEEELTNHLAVIEDRRKELEQRIDKLLGEQYFAENKWLAARQKPDLIQDQDEKKLAIDKAYLQAREAWRETYLHVISHNNTMLQLLNREVQLWQRRYTFLKKHPPAVELKTWRKEARDEIQELNRSLALQQTHQNNVQAKIAAINIQLSKENINPDIQLHLNTNLRALNKLGERNFEYLTVLQGAKELDQRLIDSIDEQLHEFNLGDRLAMVKSGIKSVWSHELLVIDTHGVTVGKIIIAFIILISGIILARLLTNLIQRQILKRLNMTVSTTAITGKLIYYTSIFLVTFIALRSVNIPMTAFTFLGGAVAIGVGFGAQKLINNFISGFILMVEQPIKVGDLVQMEGALGKIEDIGVRSTSVLTFDNVHLLVPNSYFLENNIINWTHTDNRVRGKITVGIAYGSSAKLVKKQLLDAAKEHGEVLKTPEPYVLFEDFGDNSLIFTLFFWIVVERVIDKKRIESDVRFIVDKMFHEAGLVISFPQRDIHLDSSRPLQISIVKDDNRNEPEDQQSVE